MARLRAVGAAVCALALLCVAGASAAPAATKCPLTTKEIADSSQAKDAIAAAKCDLAWKPSAAVDAEREAPPGKNASKGNKTASSAERKRTVLDSEREQMCQQCVCALVNSVADVLKARGLDFKNPDLFWACHQQQVAAWRQQLGGICQGGLEKHVCEKPSPAAGQAGCALEKQVRGSSSYFTELCPVSQQQFEGAKLQVKNGTCDVAAQRGTKASQAEACECVAKGVRPAAEAVWVAALEKQKPPPAWWNADAYKSGSAGHKAALTAGACDSVALEALRNTQPKLWANVSRPLIDNCIATEPSPMRCKTSGAGAPAAAPRALAAAAAAAAMLLALAL